MSVNLPGLLVTLECLAVAVAAAESGRSGAVRGTRRQAARAAGSVTASPGPLTRALETVTAAAGMTGPPPGLRQALDAAARLVLAVIDHGPDGARYLAAEARAAAACLPEDLRDALGVIAACADGGSEAA